MATQNQGWISARETWRYPKGAERKLKCKRNDSFRAAYELFKAMKLKTKGQPKCKQWALNKNYEIWSVSKNKRGEAQIEHFKNGTMAVRYGKTEPESIFQACEWVLSQTKLQ